MRIHLLRHAIAVPRGTPGFPTDDRPLTDEGIEKMKKAAKGIAQIVQGFDVVFSSPLIRACQTAEIAAAAVGFNGKIRIAEEFLPASSNRDMYARLSEADGADSVLIAGHEPNCSMFATFLLGGDSAVFEFKKGALCRIDVPQLKPRRVGTLVYHMPPKALRALARKNDLDE